ncbi:type II toxin-antitoxin system RelE/ParE family toxin [Photobacterium sp. OFAV2-7]|uniref:type II toxin-antitoxin system RelE/ParE family toxin n=1 Tax=Photobacterium sp. OFAV2-7 TaxID=2917748 RepID=UPI001EF6FE69|nr:type II toxin-antitoxin system RelE/ParE family toxin [Photobacterium sp. OFAV2-7]MCG7587850.1 type II toxin-antitoxin system RelE/ParE family toxin [Photobacterium sp. OFAV2-7]
MSEEQNEIDVFESRRFEKALGKLSESHLVIVEDEIEKIIADPEIGEQKKGDLSHLWVHKFKIESQQVLLGYSWVENKLELYLLNIGPHENYYQQMKKSRKADLKLIK